MKHMFKAFLCLLAIVPLTVQATVIHVPTDQPSIQAGINAASNGDTVLVADNTYYENINLKGKAITVASYYLMDGDTAHISKTIIDGSQPSNPDSGSVVYFSSANDTTSVLCGFTITGGTGTQVLADLRVGGAITCASSGGKIIRNIIRDNHVISDYEVQGGAITSGPPGSSKLVVIRNNEIKNNSASGKKGAWGGAIYLHSSGLIEINDIHHNLVTSSGGYAVGGGIHNGTEFTDKSFTVHNNIIRQNKSISEYGNNGYAGGVFISGSLYMPQVKNNEIYENYSSYKGGGLCCYYGTAVLLSDNIISNNEAGLQGGGIEINGSSPELINNTIINNYATFSGGGIGCYETSNPSIKNNLIAYNIAGQDGGGIDIYDKSNPNLVNNTIVENVATFGGALAFNKNCDPVFMNTIIYSNSADSSGNQVWFWDDNSNPTFTYCDIEGGSAAFGFGSDSYTFTGAYKNNMDNDPLFITGDSLFNLSASSPCIDAGNPDPAYNDLNGTPNDMGVYGGPDAVITAIKDNPSAEGSLPEGYTLFQNYPNPFNPKTVISYQLSVSSEVELRIFNVLGQKVAILVSERQQAGTYKVEWDAANVSSGIYFYTLRVKNALSAVSGQRMVQTKKMIVLR